MAGFREQKREEVVLRVRKERGHGVLSFKHRPEDVEVHTETGEWRVAITFRRGTATFSGRAWEPEHPVAIAACRLAQATHAQIVGDEGEKYPLQPGSKS